MGSPGRGSGPGLLPGLFSIEMLWVAWVPVIVIGTFHYTIGSDHHWAHDVLRRLYYVPILFAAFYLGLRGGFAVALASSLSYAPHAFLMEGSLDPATTANKGLEIILYNTIGIVAGVLADREAGRRREVEAALGEQKRIGDQLVRAGRLAALGELVAGLAHEIRNPLHTIKGAAEIVDEIIPRDVEQAAMWTLLRQEVERLESIAQGFLSFARPAEPERRPHPLKGIYDRIAELLRAQVAVSQVDFRAEPLPGDATALILEVDRDQLAQIMLNVGSNAIRATGGSGNLRLSASGDHTGAGALVVLRLWNDGPWIPEADLERIFDPFFTGASDGTGLGLPIASRIAEAHGGHLRVENTSEPRGVAFLLELPLDGDGGNTHG